MDTPSATHAPVADDSRPPRFTGRLFVGLTIIAIGVLFLLDAFDVPGIGDVWHLAGRIWPMVFVLIGITKLTNSRTGGERIGAAIWLVLGVLLLLNNFDLISFNVWRAFWPTLLILFGLSLLTRAWDVRVIARSRRRRLRREGFTGPETEEPTPWTDSHSRTSAFAFMSGATRRVSSPDFQGGDATAVMGGCEIDLRQSNIVSGTAVLDVFALMGGVDVFVPGDWTIRNEGIAILGAIEDNRKETAGNPNKVLVIRGAAMMGGVEIKN